MQDILKYIFWFLFDLAITNAYSMEIQPCKAANEAEFHIIGQPSISVPFLYNFVMATFQPKQLGSAAVIAISTITHDVPLPGTAVLVGSTFATQANKKVTASGSTTTKQLAN